MVQKRYIDSAKLERLISIGLEGVTLSSRSSNKFQGLSTLLAEYLGVTVQEIGVKALGEAKNFGNRISEATRAPIRYLFLLADEDVERAALGRALEARALRLVPTMLAVLSPDGWQLDCCFVPVDGSLAIEIDTEMVEVSRGTKSPESSLTDEAVAEVLALSQAPNDTDIRKALSAVDRDGSHLLIKRVSESKHLRNRISEALGRRPAVCIIDLPRSLRGSAEHAVDELRSASPSSRIFLISEGPEGLLVKERSAELGGLEHEPQARAGVGVSRPEERTEGERRPSRSNRPSEPPRYRELERVKQLRCHLPLNAGADRLYEEHLDSDDRLRYETKTLTYLRKLLASPEPVMIVLTGNAGHGKTHMCRRLLEEGDQNLDVMETLNADPVGGKDWSVAGVALPVRVIKDLSELNPPDKAAQRLETLIQQEHAHAIVCANEGRLRDVVARRATHLSPLLAALEHGLEKGETSPPDHPAVHVVNLNYQAAAGVDGGFLKYVLDHFLNYQSAWSVCRTCLAHDACPIRANRDELALAPSSPPQNSTRRDSLSELVRIAEEGGYVLTYREVLILVAYLVTGGLACKDVEQLHKKRKWACLDSYGLLDLLFEPKLTDDEAEVLQVLKRIARLDPGRIALRPVDERLHAELEEQDQLGDGLFDLASKQLHKKSELKKEEQLHQRRLRRARRTAWLASKDGTDGVRRPERLGLRYHHLFQALQGTTEVREVIETIRSLVKGLHTIQGAVGVDSMTSFHLVDPAFGRSGSHAAIIARSLRVKDLDLDTEANWWRKLQGNGTPPILESVEWIDRRLILGDPRTKERLLSLDLLAFEFVMSAARGIVMRDFYSAERRRILRFLAQQAEKKGDVTDDIRVLLERGEGTLTVERDGTILLERNA